MNICIVTGSSGLIGSESVSFFSSKFDKIIGIDNNMRAVFFGKDASTEWNTKRLVDSTANFEHHALDIRDMDGLNKLFAKYNTDIKLIVHAAAQPSHDWAAREPITDFTVNANGTLNMLEAARLHCPKATFIFTSTNKVYGDTPNYLPLVELEKRWEIDTKHPYYKEGIDEFMSIDQTKHSLFGASKVAADVLVQEYGKYFEMNTGVFRGGCLTGPNHSGTQLHGFLSYLMKCAITGDKYTVFGYHGKQVRDNIHSWDLVNMFWHFYQNPKKGEVYNAGGGRHSNCSMAEAIDLCEKITGKKMNYEYTEANRIGDHIWWISDLTKFKKDYPEWTWKYDINDILTQIHSNMSQRQL
ncbi:NAD-dependent epimerase/dehydratase family protein [Aurantibacillus circumpalustris]|uniref:NAD-dependent epimerase/dehydratase family protein n=1 Tax=Aurantibacillus circumpalustris TaxID=3036359 RepID=UPI00295C01A0|nr:NAD-dependent epimerase/dehydratase family protein [Aurantibacillus circumpalustris]